MDLEILPSAKRLRRLVPEWPESCYERFNVQPSAPFEELLSLALSGQAPAVVVLAGASGIGRGYLCRAAQHRAQDGGRRLSVWNLDLQGLEPEGQDSLAAYLEQLIARQERDQAASRQQAVDTLKLATKALTQTKHLGSTSEWAAALLSLLWQFEDPLGRFVELSSQPGSHQVALRDDPETLKRCLDELTQERKLLIHVRDSDELPISLRRWLIEQAENAPERLFLVMSCGLGRETESVAPYCRQPPARIELRPLTSTQLRQILDRCFDPNALPDELIDGLIRQSGGRPGAIANRIADLMDLRVLDRDAQGTWQLPVEEQRAGGALDAGLFQDVDRRIAEESPQREKILHGVLVLAALSGEYVPLLPIFDHLQLDEDEREAVTDFLDDVLDEELGWLSDCGFQHPSFPGFNAYVFTSRLLPGTILDQIPDLEREMRAISFLRFLEEHARPATRGMTKWFLDLARHLGDRERRPYESQLSWWCTQAEADGLRDEIRSSLEEGQLEPEGVWRIAQGSEHWPPYRRLALLDALSDTELGDGDGAETDRPLSREQLALFRILRSRLRYSVGRYADSLEDAMLAQPLVEAGSLEEAKVINLAGISRLGLGTADAATADFERATSIFLRSLGPEHPSTLTSQGNLASTYRARGNYETAGELEESVWQARRRVLEPEHPDTLKSQANLALTYRAQGNYERARELVEGVWKALSRILGPEHPDTLTIQGNLASAYSDQGNYESARQHGVAAWEALGRVLGPDHPLTLVSKDNLDLTLQKLAAQARDRS